MKCTECVFFENPSYIEGGEVYQADYAKCRLYKLTLSGEYDGQDEHEGNIWDFSGCKCPHPEETRKVLALIKQVRKVKEVQDERENLGKER